MLFSGDRAWFERRLEEWEKVMQFDDVIQFSIKPQHLELVILPDRKGYPGYGTNYLQVVDAVRLAPLNDGTLEIVSKDREKIPSAEPWNDSIDVVSFNFFYNDVIVRIAHIDLPFVPAEGLTPPWYVQGTRTYTSIEFWTHPLIFQTDYIVKLDLDIYFFGCFPSRIVEDMDLRGPLFGHTAVVSSIMKDNVKRVCIAEQTCADNHKSFMDSVLERNRISACASLDYVFKVGADLLYTNLVFMKTELF